jgi:hypothetical protein
MPNHQAGMQHIVYDGGYKVEGGQFTMHDVKVTVTDAPEPGIRQEYQESVNSEQKLPQALVCDGSKLDVHVAGISVEHWDRD